MKHVCTCDGCQVGVYEDECKFEAELDWLQEENERLHLLDRFGAYGLMTQRDTLLAALEEAIDCLEGACLFLHGGTNEDIARRLRAAISEVEREKP